MAYEESGTEKPPADDFSDDKNAIVEDAEKPRKAMKLAELLAGAAPETVNVKDACTDEELAELGASTIKKGKRDRQSSQKWRDRHANIIKLFFGDLPPLPNGEELANAQIHYPIIATAVVRISARLRDQQFPSSGEYFGAVPTDATDMERSIRIPKHMNWQVQHKAPEYVPNHAVCITQMCLYGSAFTMVSYDPQRQCWRHDVIATNDIILPYKRKSTDPNLADMPRITRVLRLQRYELEALEDDGYYSGIDELYEEEDENGGPRLSSATDEDEDDVIQKAVDHDAGIEKPENDPDAPRVLWEMHCRYKFKGEKRTRPVIVTVDKLTKKVVCIKIREDEDPVDRARYNREVEANQAAYDAAMAQYQAAMVQYVMTGGAPGMAPPMDMTLPPLPGETDMAVPMTPMEGPPLAAPPEKPLPPPEPEKPRMIPINHFYHYKCLPNPEGVYGNGIGTLLEGHNMFADTVGAQIVNAGTLANTKGGFISRQMRGVRGDVKFRPGEYQETDAVGDMSKLILTMDFKGPDAAMGQLIRDQQEAGAQVSGATEILSGEVGGSNETATTTQIRIGEAMTNIAIMGKDYTLVRTAEARGIARINSVHVTDVEYFAVVDPYKQIPGGPPVVDEMQVSRADYLQDYDITITADPRMASKAQRVAEATQIINSIALLPALAGNMNLQLAAGRRLFMAMDAPEMVAAMMSMPPMPMAPPGAPPPGGGEEEPSGGGPPRPEPMAPPVPGTNQPQNGGMVA